MNYINIYEYRPLPPPSQQPNIYLNFQFDEKFRRRLHFIYYNEPTSPIFVVQKGGRRYHVSFYDGSVNIYDKEPYDKIGYFRIHKCTTHNTQCESLPMIVTPTITSSPTSHDLELVKDVCEKIVDALLEIRNLPTRKSIARVLTTRMDKAAGYPYDVQYLGREIAAYTGSKKPHPSGTFLRTNLRGGKSSKRTHKRHSRSLKRRYR